MDCRCIGFVLFLVTLVTNINGFTSYKWVPLKFGQVLPENIVSMHGSSWYVGRAKVNNDIVPAKISPKGSAFISSAGKLLAVDSFEILTTGSGFGECEWHSIRKDNHDKMVEVVTDTNGDPIFIGFNLELMEYNFVKREEIPLWYEKYIIGGDDVEFLECKLKMSWFEHSPSSTMQLPNKMVFSGDGNYVARLKKDSTDFAIGQFEPQTRIAFGYLDDGRIYRDSHCELLIGEPNEYKWVSASNGKVADYAIAFMKNPVISDIQMSFVTRINNTIRKLTNIELRDKLNYDILTMNHL